MLSILLTFSILAALLNIGLYVAAVKTKLFILLRVDPCVFCLMFWLAAGEYLIYSFFMDITMAIAPIPGLASAAAAILLFQNLNLGQK